MTLLLNKTNKFLIFSLIYSYEVTSFFLSISLFLFFVLYAVSQKQYVRMFPVVFGTLILVGGAYLYLDLGMEDFLTYGYLRHQGLFYVVNALVFCFHWGLPLAIWGFCLGKEKRSFYLAYLISTSLCYLVFVHNPRLMFVVYPAVFPLIVQGMEACVYWLTNHREQKHERTITALVVGYMLTSNILTVVYLFITRVFQYRSVESLTHLLG